MAANSKKYVEQYRDTKTFVDGLLGESAKLNQRLSLVETGAPSRRWLYVGVNPVELINTAAETVAASIPVAPSSLGSLGLIDFEAWWRLRNVSGSSITATFRQKYGTSALTLGPYTLAASTESRLLIIRGFLVGAGTPTSQRCMAQVEMYPAYPTTSGAETFNVSNRATFAENSEIELAFAMTAQLSVASPFMFAYCEMIRFGYPIPGI